MATKVVAWIAVGFGSMAIISGLVDASWDPDYMYAIVGGGLYVGLGALTIDYIQKHPDKKE
jgi:hypothetical protein